MANETKEAKNSETSRIKILGNFPTKERREGKDGKKQKIGPQYSTIAGCVLLGILYLHFEQPKFGWPCGLITRCLLRGGSSVGSSSSDGNIGTNVMVFYYLHIVLCTETHAPFESL